MFNPKVLKTFVIFHCSTSSPRFGPAAFTPIKSNATCLRLGNPRFNWVCTGLSRPNEVPRHVCIFIKYIIKLNCIYFSIYYKITMLNKRSTEKLSVPRSKKARRSLTVKIRRK